MSKYLPILLIIAFFISCQEETLEEKEQTALHEKVMEIHDAVMPEMSTINRISRSLKKIKDNNSPGADILSQIESSLKDLESADEGMMDWMQNYTKPKKMRGEKTHAEIMSYLNAEMEKISQVKKNMEESIQNGKQLLEIFQ